MNYNINIPGVFNANKTKVLLKVAVNRLKLVQQKKTGLNQMARKEIANLLEKGKEDSARVRVENIIREDYTIEALELLELYVETLSARFGLVESMKTCDPSLVEAVQTLIWSAPRVEIKELGQVRDQMIIKFGKEFAMNAMENASNHVNPRIIQKLKNATPAPVLVNQYLKTIAAAFSVDWQEPVDTPVDTLSSGLANPNIESYPQQYPLQYQQQYPQQQYSQQQAFPQGQGPSAPDLLADIKKPLPTVPSTTILPTVPTSNPSNASVTVPDQSPDFDDLAKRFEALKKRK